MTVDDQSAVVELWQKCNLTRPWNDPEQDIAFALKGSTSTILVGKFAGKIIAAAMVGHDGHRGALYYLAIDPQFQNKGYGKMLIAEAESWLKQRGVWKINILIRNDNQHAVGFYKALGFEDNAVVSMGRKIL
jgi:ribosomal protein S18 acetylase RimI-like enzyme